MTSPAGSAVGLATTTGTGPEGRGKVPPWRGLTRKFARDERTIAYVRYGKGPISIESGTDAWHFRASDMRESPWPFTWSEILSTSGAATAKRKAASSFN